MPEKPKKNTPSSAALARQIRELEKKVAALKEAVHEAASTISTLVNAFERQADASTYWTIKLGKDTAAKARGLLQ